MRIGVLTYGVTGAHTGIGRYTVELTRALRRVRPDADVILLTPYEGAPIPWYEEFERYPVPSLRLMPALMTIGHRVLDRAAREASLDVLFDPCGIAPFLVPRGDYARVTTVHDAIPLTHPRTQPLLTRLLYATLVRHAGVSADAILTVSQAAANDLVRHLGLPREKLVVTPNGVRVPAPGAPWAVEGLDEGAPFFLCVGALHPRKNLGRVVAAFERVHARHPGFSLVIAGPPSWGAHASQREVVEAARAHPAIHFTGFVSDDALHALYRQAVALVMVSLYEGFGLPALEAMAHGTPVVAANTSALPEVVGEAGLLVDPLDVGAIEGAMLRVACEPGLRPRLACAGRARAGEFTWEATARGTLAVFDRLVSGGPPRARRA